MADSPDEEGEGMESQWGHREKGSSGEAAGLRLGRTIHNGPPDILILGGVPTRSGVLNSTPDAP